MLALGSPLGWGRKFRSKRRQEKYMNHFDTKAKDGKISFMNTLEQLVIIAIIKAELKAFFKSRINESEEKKKKSVERGDLSSIISVESVQSKDINSSFKTETEYSCRSEI